MSGVQFYETRAGRTFFEVTMPALVAELARLNDLLASLIAQRDAPNHEPPVHEMGKP
jgi:hypothetical protein